MSANVTHDWVPNMSQNELSIPLRCVMLSRKRNKPLKNMHTAFLCCAETRVHATFSRGMTCVRASRHQFSPVQASLAPCPCEPRRSSGVKTPCRWTKPSTNNWSSYVERRGERIRGYNDTTGVGGADVMMWRCQWRSGSRRLSAETGIVGKTHFDITTCINI